MPLFKVEIRRGSEWPEVRPNAERIDGGVFNFEFGWTLDDLGDLARHPEYKGESAFIPRDKNYPIDGPTWIASGDLKETKLGRYLLFGGNGDPEGGWSDFVEIFETHEEASQYADSGFMPYPDFTWYQIVDVYAAGGLAPYEIVETGNRILRENKTEWEVDSDGTN